MSRPKSRFPNCPVCGCDKFKYIRVSCSQGYAGSSPDTKACEKCGCIVSSEVVWVDEDDENDK